jgi:hypothetical protein
MQWRLTDVFHPRRYEKGVYRVTFAKSSRLTDENTFGTNVKARDKSHAVKVATAELLRIRGGTMRKRRSKARHIKTLPQTGRSNTRADRKRRAKKPGVRISRTGRRYTETRKNRSDKKGKRT